MEIGESREVVCVRVPARLKEKLGAVARQLHCTPSEAALLAIRNQLETMDISSLPGGQGPGSAGSPPRTRESKQANTSPPEPK